MTTRPNKMVDGVVVPLTDAEWNEFLARQNAPAPVVVPSFVTPAQAKLALYQAGKLADVEAAVAAHPYEPVRIYFNNALQWERDNPYVMGLAQQLSWSETEVDALFIAASKIV